jgi:poly-gamma-glutamate synthesis protein (capsule biosynthesis protein)
MKFCAVGDIIIGRRIQPDFAGYSELCPIINQADARFFNLETTLNYEGECYASQVSGGTYLRTDPEVLEDIQKFGFNMTSFNNNHVMDYSFEGLLHTLDAVNKSGLVHSGVGRNLGEAAAPKYLETSSGRVALISLNSTLSGQMCAGEQSDRIPGRPGVNPLRITQHVELEQEDFDSIKRIIRKTGINAAKEITKKEGYYGGADDKAEYIGDITFSCGEQAKFIQKIKQADLDRVAKSIYEAQLQADYIVISVHSHQLEGFEKENPSGFLQEFAHFCIDKGAHAVVGHGPHLLRPVEIYKQRPIFYSLGDFVLQLYNVAFAPDEFYSQYGLTTQNTVHELLKKRSQNFTVGLMADKRMFTTIIPYWEMEDGKLTKLTLYPILLSMDGNKSEIGLPRLCNDPDLLQDFVARSEKFGTIMTRNPDGTYEVKL